MEYLMTYGWAILIIAVVLGALFQLGVFNSASFSPRAPPGACQVFRPSGPGTTTNINLMGVCTGQLPQYVAKFNGASSYVSILDSSILRFGTASFSISLWVKGPSSQNPTPVLIGKSSSSGAYGFRNYPANHWYWRLDDDASHAVDSVRSNAFDGNWHLLTLSVDRTSATAYAYIDGKQDGAAVGISVLTGNISPISNLIIGGISDYFNGTISNVQIYNASLSANQIQALYLEGIGGAPMKLQNLVGWWPLNGNANDYSGNNNNGVPTSVTFTSQYGK